MRLNQEKTKKGIVEDLDLVRDLYLDLYHHPDSRSSGKPEKKKKKNKQTNPEKLAMK